MKPDHEPDPPPSEESRLDWVPGLFSALGIKAGASLKEIIGRCDTAAKGLSVQTRRLWRWILACEGAAVLLPLLWLLVLRQRWAPAYTAYAVLVCTFFIVAACWWMRWRGMQHTWTHARLVAEVGRSLMATNWLPAHVTQEALGSGPIARSLAELLPQEKDPAAAPSPEDIKERYTRERINDQIAYYSRERKKALADRQRLSRYVTWSLDGALFMAVAGVVLVLSGKGELVLKFSGLDYLLGLMGTALPLTAILMQSLSSYLELNRRNARYAQQAEYLRVAKGRLASAADLEQALSVVREVEQSELSEALEWFYQAEHTELFYRPAHSKSSFVRQNSPLAHISWIQRMLGGLGIGASYVVAVVFRLLLVAAVSAVATAALIGWRAPNNAIVQSELSVGDGRLLSRADAQGWEPQPERTEHGFVLIAHGLHDGVLLPPKRGEDLHWMRGMQEALETKLGGNAPDICLVDWHDVADNPSVISGDPVSDITSIRAQGAAIGQLVGYKLAIAIQSGKIRRDRPMHFIGHSAGGFVILGVARVLVSLGLAPQQLRLTILDTPKPDLGPDGDFEQVVKVFPVDYYCTSPFTSNLMPPFENVPLSGIHPHYTRFDIEPPLDKRGIDHAIEAHSYAHEWYTKTIGEFHDTRGFARSPFAPQAAP